ELVSYLLPEVRSQGRRSRRGGAPGGVAVCCCLPAIREISRGLLTMRLSALRLPSSARGDFGKARTQRAARMRKLGCLKLWIWKSQRPFPGRDAARRTSPRHASLNRDRTKHRRSLRPRLCSAPLRKSYALRYVRGTRGVIAPHAR